MNWNLYNNDLAIKDSKINVIRDKTCVDKNALWEVFYAISESH